MVGKVPAVVCMLLGLVALIAAGIAGIAFQASNEFVVATVTCNPDAEDSLATDENCVNNVVVDSDGEVCQIGALGLFTADFTPECTYDGPYAINPLLVPQANIDPLEFGVLFPAQNELGGLGVEEALNVTEFDNCEDYFDISGDFVESLQRVSAVGVNDVVNDLKNTTKISYDSSLEANFAQADVIFSNLPGAILTIIAGVPGAPAVTDAYDAAYITAMNTALTNVGGAGTDLGGIIFLVITVQAAGETADAGCGTGGSPLGIHCLGYGLSDSAAGYTASAAGFAPGVLETGYFSPLDGFLCQILDPPATECTFQEFFVALAGLGLEGLEDLPSLLTLLGIAQGIADSNNGGLSSAAALQEIRDDTATGQALVANLYGKSAMIGILQGLLSLEGAVPEDLFGPAAASEPGFGIVCGSLNLSSTCSFDEIIDAQIAAEEAEVAPDAELLEELALGNLLLGGCQSVGITTLTACVLEVAVFADFGGDTGVPIEQAADQVLGGLYGIENVSFADALEAAIEACEDDELDAAAITQAQMLVPPGVALVLVGAGIGVAALVTFALANKKVAKAVVVLGGAVSLVGGIIVLVALLGVYNAPIYASVGGGDGDIEDNDRLFSSGSGLTLALVAIGGSLVGAIVMTIGGLMLPTSDDDDVLAAKA